MGSQTGLDAMLGARTLDLQQDAEEPFLVRVADDESKRSRGRAKEISERVISVDVIRNDRSSNSECGPDAPQLECQVPPSVEAVMDKEVNVLEVGNE